MAEPFERRTAYRVAGVLPPFALPVTLGRTMLRRCRALRPTAMLSHVGRHPTAHDQSSTTELGGWPNGRPTDFVARFGAGSAALGRNLGAYALSLANVRGARLHGLPVEDTEDDVDRGASSTLWLLPPPY